MAQIRGSQISGSVASASFALTASFALNTGGVSAFITTGSISASVNLSGDIFLVKSGSYERFTVSETGLVTVSGSATNLFLIKNTSNQPILTVSQSGIVVLSTQSVQITSAAPVGGMYFTSGSFFVGLD